MPISAVFRLIFGLMVGAVVPLAAAAVPAHQIGRRSRVTIMRVLTL